MPNPDFSLHDPFFEQAPVGLWEADFSVARLALEAQLACGPEERLTFLARHPEQASWLAGQVCLLRANPVARRLLGEPDGTAQDGWRTLFLRLLFALSRGERPGRLELPGTAREAEGGSVGVLWRVMAGSESSWGRVLGSLEVGLASLEPTEFALDEAWLRVLFERSPVAIGLSRDGLSLRTNPAYRTLFGYGSDAELSGRPLLDTIAPNQRREVEERIRRRAQGSQVAAYETIGLRRDGTEFPISVIATRVETPRGPLTLGFMTDISERKRAEASLKDALELTRSLISASTLGILAYRAEGQCILANQAAAGMAGAPSVELEGQNFRTLPSWQASGMYAKALRALESHREERLETHLSTSFGKEVWVDCSFSAFDSHGSPHLLVTLVDITQRMKLEALRNEFLSQAAHELKTPLTVIKTYVQLLQRWRGQLAESREGSALKVINRQSDRMQRLVQDLLEMSRLQHGKFQAFPKRLDLAELVEAVVTEMGSTTARHRLTLALRDRPVVYADPERLEQVLMNLLDNAIRYSPAGGAVHTEVFVEPRFAEVAVTDHGLGIPAERQAQVFDAFFRAHAGTPDDFGGMGVGLHVSRQILELQGGQIDFRSEEGVGSTFRIRLPLYNEGTDEYRP